MQGVWKRAWYDLNDLVLCWEPRMPIKPIRSERRRARISFISSTSRHAHRLIP
jgi:hypothetical protein